MNRILILGASGLVGKALTRELNSEYDVYGTYNQKQTNLPKEKAFKLEIDEEDSINKILEKIKPQIIISCLRGNFDKQLVVHKRVASYLKNSKGKLLFCSTGNVFDNDFSKPFYEDDKTNPKSEYGRYKAKCERELEKILDRNLVILRLPMIWGKDSPRLNDLVNKLKENKEIEGYKNLYKNANTDTMIAQQIHYILKNNLTGIFHLGSSDYVRHDEFLVELCNKLGYQSPNIEYKTFPEDTFLAIMSKRDNMLARFNFSYHDVINDLCS